MTLFVLTLALALDAAAAGPSETPWTPEQAQQMLAELTEITRDKSKLPNPARTEDKRAVEKLLDEMFEVDQAYRKLGLALGDVDAVCTGVMKHWLTQIDWFRISQWSEIVDNRAWLIVQHADRDLPFQQLVLERLTKLVEQREASRSSYAYLFDRVALNAGKKQRYGTQGRCVGPGDWQPRDIEEPATVDERRAWAEIRGFPKLADYKKQMDGHCKGDQR